MRERLQRAVSAAATWAGIASDLLAAVRRMLEALPTRSEEKP